MLDIHRTNSKPSRKVYFTHSILPPYIDPHNVSTKKFPFTTFNSQPFSHTLDLILPAELYLLVQHHLATGTYARVHLTLLELLSPDFLETYIKQGNITMLSQGREHIDNRFQLRSGKLRMELDRATYERCGLQGTPIEDGGKKHQKARWVVEYDLTLGSMRRGKRGFGRLLWAAEHVLDSRVTWLWWNHHPGAREALRDGREVLSQFAPGVCEIEPVVARLRGVSFPRLELAALRKCYGDDGGWGFLEYLHLLALDSPRVYAADDIDTHLSRYEVPDFGHGAITRDLVSVRWRGFMPPAFVTDVFLTAREYAFMRKSTDGGEQDVPTAEVQEKEVGWFAMSAQGFGGKRSWTVMQFENRETLTWQVEG